ncbi:unnamed protein product [Rotaria socialis]|uniref:Uncharacterized protein n=1 Tax=Rotaria socialis TaxID=392032 RepID=A0A818C886_9BILA|nr:unnamed protein product [Rotaria socialis]CAF3328599.1 unnamed protein product [Rotaria socialis]CAF3428688.1 unnamed protein product [Rotaria socialis]CAF4385358.1 unnamed protein product [Rotaria socialis]CAF4576019.1 unnamed protein product [Rotaria socialis]
MHPVGQQQQQQQRRGNSTRMPLMYSPSLPPAPLLPGPPQALRYGVLGNFQQPPVSSGGMKHHQRGSGNRGGRGSTIIHRQTRPTPGSRYHPYPFRQPLPPQQQQRFYRPAQQLQRTPAALMGTPPGMSQSEYELIHSAQVQRDKKKLDVLAPSNTTQFLIRDHNRQSTPSSIATPTPTHPTTPSPSATQQGQPSLPYDQMFEMGDVDAQSDDTESNQGFGFGDVDPSVDNDFNDIYYQCRYERYAAFSRAALLNEVLSLCANIDRLQHEKSEVEKRLRDVQQHLYDLTTATNGIQERPIQEEITQLTDDQTRLQASVQDQQQTDSNATNDVNHIDDELQPPVSSQPIVTENEVMNESLPVTTLPESNESEQQIVHD